MRELWPRRIQQQTSAGANRSYVALPWAGFSPASSKPQHKNDRLGREGGRSATLPIIHKSNTILTSIVWPAARPGRCGCRLKRPSTILLCTAAASTMSSSTKVEHKAVYDLARKELKNRTEIKLDSGLKVGCRCVWVGGCRHHSGDSPLSHPCPQLATQIGLNYSDKTNLVSIDTERGPLKFGYDFQREVRRQASPAPCKRLQPTGLHCLLRRRLRHPFLAAASTTPRAGPCVPVHPQERCSHHQGAASGARHALGSCALTRRRGETGSGPPPPHTHLAGRERRSGR